tara:strand:- start:343 stop:714 length:372 start_codon:yes stop_codon:yes gene_type:complete
MASNHTKVNENLATIVELIHSGESQKWTGDFGYGHALIQKFQLCLDDIASMTGYDSWANPFEGETPLELLLDQLNGAIEAQTSFDGLHVGSWSQLKSEVEEFLSHEKSGLCRECGHYKSGEEM